MNPARGSIILMFLVVKARLYKVFSLHKSNGCQKVKLCCRVQSLQCYTRRSVEESIAAIDEKAKTARKVRPTGHIKKLQTKKFTKNMNSLCRKRPRYITIRMPIRLVKDPKIDQKKLMWNLTRRHIFLIVFATLRFDILFFHLPFIKMSFSKSKSLPRSFWTYERVQILKWPWKFQ